MAIRTSIAKAATATAELTDIEVLEVANVDAPANKRPFVVVKSAEGSEPPVVPVANEPAAPVVPAPEAVTAPVTIEQAAIDAAAAAALAAPVVPPSEPAAVETPIEKRGAKMAKDRLTRLKATHAELGKILKELSDEVAEEEESTKSKVTKADEANPLAPQVEALTRSATDLQAKLAEQEKTIADQGVAIAKQAEIIKAAKRVPAPNSSDPQEVVVKAEKKVVWPY